MDADSSAKRSKRLEIVEVFDWFNEVEIVSRRSISQSGQNQLCHPSGLDCINLNRL